MCGIVGYVGSDDACSFLIDGLRRLEYRGYDSSGIAVHGGTSFSVTRSVGRIDSLVGRLGETPVAGPLGIGHTRWATHGPATEANAHPHLGGDGEVVLVHNGVIENFQVLKEELIGKGYEFKSETDSEVIAHLIAEGVERNGGSQRPTQHALFDGRAVGGGSIAWNLRAGDRVSRQAQLDDRGSIRQPTGDRVGKGEYFVSSDASPLVGRTDRIVYLADHQIAVLTAEGFSVLHRDQGKIRVDIRPLGSRQR